MRYSLALLALVGASQAIRLHAHQENVDNSTSGSEEVPPGGDKPDGGDGEVTEVDWRAGPIKDTWEGMTQEELDAVVENWVLQYDFDGSGGLSLSELDAFWAGAL